MIHDRYLVIGLARVRAPWFNEVAGWAQAAAVPIEFVKCISPAEAHARLDSGRAFSALVLDAGAAGIDRDLLDQARRLGIASIIIDDPRVERDWLALGASAVLPHRFERADLVASLAEHARPIQAVTATSAAGLVDGRDIEPSVWHGRVIAVCGVSGSGASTVAMALAQALAADPVDRGSVALADLSLRGDLAMYHDTGDVVPGLQEVVEAHQSGRPTTATLRRMLYDIEPRGYQLLLGLRRSRDWTATRPRALEAAIESLAGAFRQVVLDIDADFDGEDVTGSVDVEERNAAARLAASRADACVVVTTPTLHGLHGAGRIAADLDELGIAADRVLHVVNRAPRSPRRRAEIVAALAGRDPRHGHPATVFLPERRSLEAVHRAGGALPSSFGDVVRRGLAATTACADDQRSAVGDGVPADGEARTWDRRRTA